MLVLACEIQKSAQLYNRQSKMYNHTNALKNLPLQSVSSRRNLQVADVNQFRRRGRIKKETWVRGCSNRMQCGMPEIYFCRQAFLLLCKHAIILFF